MRGRAAHGSEHTGTDRRRSGSGRAKAAWRSFWLTHIRIGFGIFLAETLVVAGYLALDPRFPPAGPVGGGGQLASCWPWWGWHWRRWWPPNRGVPPTLTWTALSAFGVAIVAILDTGMNSPLLILLFLPLIYGRR